MSNNGVLGPGIWFIGGRAGLITRKIDGEGGDMNSPFDYVLVCRCGTMLGPLGRFSANADGARSAGCPLCDHMTVVGKSGQITHYEPLPKRAVL